MERGFLAWKLGNVSEDPERDVWLKVLFCTPNGLEAYLRATGKSRSEVDAQHVAETPDRPWTHRDHLGLNLPELRPHVDIPPEGVVGIPLFLQVIGAPVSTPEELTGCIVRTSGPYVWPSPIDRTCTVTGIEYIWRPGREIRIFLEDQDPPTERWTLPPLVGAPDREQGWCPVGESGGIRIGSLRFHIGTQSVRASAHLSNDPTSVGWTIDRLLITPPQTNS